MAESKNIQFTNLYTFIVGYSSESIDALIDISIESFYVAKYSIKNLTMNINPLGLIQSNT